MAGGRWRHALNITLTAVTKAAPNPIHWEEVFLDSNQISKMYRGIDYRNLLKAKGHIVGLQFDGRMLTLA